MTEPDVEWKGAELDKVIAQTVVKRNGCAGNHEDPKDIGEQIGLEYLTNLSVLARSVDDAEVEAAA
ncbi:hypothetical protein ACDF64_04695 [Agromyces sp. MMS24-JH15]|uniref:hypothetical protein n=1 Tax=Agromyces sp. MMS24-JH15 TaxID=3243765 RepID=UPI0037490C2E